MNLANNNDPAQQPVVPEVSQTSRGRGRGRGGRGRGGGGRGGMQRVQLESELTQVTRPERTRYVVDIVGIVNCLSWIARFIVTLPRRGRWLDSGYYAGIFLYAFAAKLQRVGIATNQITVNAASMIGVGGIEIPTVVATLIDQFGQVYSLMRIEVVPYVSEMLVQTIVRLAYKLADVDFTGASPHGNNIPVNNGTLKVWSWLSMGLAYHYTQCLCSLATELGVGTSFLSVTEDGINLCAATILLQADAINVIGPNPFIAAIATPGQNAFHAFLLQSFAPGVVAVPAANLAVNAIDPVVRVALVTTHNELVPINNLVNGDGFNNPVMANKPPYGFDTYIAQSVELSHQFDLVPCPLSSSGTLAPLVVVTEVGGYTSAGAVEPMSTQEWAIGMQLGANAMLLDKSDMPFNYTDPMRRVLKYTVPPVHKPRSALVTMLIRDSCKQINKS